MTADQQPETAAKVRIRGHVQGVWFRAWTAQEARRRRLRGWVRNRRDGSVEALFIGPPAAVNEMIATCWDGPPSARVDSVDQEPATPTADPGFITLPSQ